MSLVSRRRFDASLMRGGGRTSIRLCGARGSSWSYALILRLMKWVLELEGYALDLGKSMAEAPFWLACLSARYLLVTVCISARCLLQLYAWKVVE